MVPALQWWAAWEHANRCSISIGERG